MLTLSALLLSACGAFMPAAQPRGGAPHVVHPQSRAPPPRVAFEAAMQTYAAAAQGAAAQALSVAASPAAESPDCDWQRMVCVAGDSGEELIPPALLRQLHHSTWYLQEHALVIQRAVQTAALAHAGQTRKNGDAFITHPIETAIILAGLKMDVDTIVAGVLHDTVEDTSLTLRDIEEMFGPSVASIVRGDSKVTKLDEASALLPAEARRELDRRNMLLAMGAYWRVVVVKLADRLHNMRTLQHMPRHKQVRIARETIEIFVPLAHRLGIDSLEYQLLNHSVHYLFPQELLGLFGLELFGHWARLQCWGVLDDFLLHDQVLSELDVKQQLSSHRERWSQHVDYWGVAFAK